ncbi:MAG: hypothetical protein Q8O88_05710 [bacterium]|nr:hypothetical protein [bacterium]
MDTSFEELKVITDQVYSIHSMNRIKFHQEIVDLLSRHGINLRNKNGSNPIVTISHPTSLPGSMVVGLRYTKLDGTKTEDHFLFQANVKIEKCYGKRLERLFHEYSGAHKLQR